VTRLACQAFCLGVLAAFTGRCARLADFVDADVSDGTG
jgi:hypothetical protein